MHFICVLKMTQMVCLFFFFPLETESADYTCDSILGSCEYIIELLLQRFAFAEGPVGVLLMAKNDVVEDGLGDAEPGNHLTVNLGTLRADAHFLSMPEVDEQLEQGERENKEVKASLHN